MQKPGVINIGLRRRHDLERQRAAAELFRQVLLGDSNKAHRVATANGRAYAADAEEYVLDICAAAYACVTQETALPSLRAYREEIDRQLQAIAPDDQVEPAPAE